MKILFVCTGNVCRSPMAEGIFKKAAADRGIKNAECSSAGFFARAGEPAVPEAVKACERFNVDISAHGAKRITGRLLDETDKFVCMTRANAASLALCADAKKIVVLGDGIFDPSGGDLETYIRCANLIKTALRNQFDEITARVK